MGGVGRAVVSTRFAGTAEQRVLRAVTEPRCSGSRIRVFLLWELKQMGTCLNLQE